jgi:hypothetical protein
MAVSCPVLLGLGVVAFLTTLIVFILEIVNAQTARIAQTVQQASAASAALEGLVLIMILVLTCMSARHSTYYGPKKLGEIWFPVGIVLVVIAAVPSVVALAALGTETEDVHILGGPEQAYLIGTGAVLGLALAAQLTFVVVYFVGSRLPGNDEERAFHVPNPNRVKSVRYSQTIMGAAEESKQPIPSDFRSPPGSSSGRSVAETVSSIRTSLSHKVRHVDSRTRLLSIKSTKSTLNSAKSNGSIWSRARGESLDSMMAPGEGFDSWDTSSVETQNRHVLDITAPPPARFLGALETIPASPTVSRAPSPGSPLDLEAQAERLHRTRSYSPLPRPPSTVLKTYSSSSELHIHPLFRADSPTPPPAATPGTTILAAPETARTLSAKSLTRMRSGSFPSLNPLSHRGSEENLKSKPPTPERLSPLSSELEEEKERQMTPPLPEWILNAGARTSLTEYQLRKQRDRETKVDSGLDLLP